MTLKLELTEEEISQIISEETKSLMEERQQLNELVPLYVAGVGLTFAGKAALATLAGLGLWQSYDHVMSLTSDPDTEGILRMIPEEESKVVKARMKEYFEAYTNLVKQTTNYIFIPTSTLSRAKEYIPDLGFSNLYAWATGTEDSTEGVTFNYEPGKPSKEAKARQVAFSQELNKIVEENPPIVTTELRPGSISTRAKALVKSTIEKEFEIARQPTLVGSYMNRMPVKSPTDAIAQLNKLVDALEAAAIAANQATEVGKARALAKAKEKAPKGSAKPGEEGTQGGVEQVRAALTPRYKNTAATQESVLAGRDVVKPFDKTSRTGVVGVIQGLLQQAGFPIGKDGFFGPKTKQAVEKFQQSTGSALQEQEVAEGVVDSKLLARLIGVASDKEIEANASGDFLSTTPTAAKQDEASADNIPAPALQKKIEKLEAKIEQGKVSKEAKAQARLDRMKKRLEFKMGKAAPRQQRNPKKMKVTEKQLQEMIAEETKNLLSENTDINVEELSKLTHDQRMTRYGKALDPFIKQRAAWFKTYIEERIRDKSYRKADERVSTYKSLYYSPFAGLEIESVNYTGNRTDFLAWFEAQRKERVKKFRKNATALISKLNDENYYSVGELVEPRKAYDELSDAVIPLAGPAFAALRDVYVVQKKAPEATVTGDASKMKAVEIPSTTAPRAAKTTTSAWDGPADWGAFASVSPNHAEMAKAWIAATSGNRNVSEAALPFDDSSYKAFQKWYAATAKELGRQFDPTEAIELIAQDSKKPKTASPEAAEKMRAAMAGTTVADKLPSARFNLTSELDSLNIELGKLMDEKPMVAKNFKNKKTSGLRLRKDIEAYEEMVQLSNRIKQVKKDLKSLEESVINESTYSRWQKLIKN